MSARRSRLRTVPLEQPRISAVSSIERRRARAGPRDQQVLLALRLLDRQPVEDGLDAVLVDGGLDSTGASRRGMLECLEQARRLVLVIRLAIEGQRPGQRHVGQQREGDVDEGQLFETQGQGPTGHGEVALAGVRPGDADVVCLQVEVDEAERVLGWKPQTSFEELIRRTFESLRGAPRRGL